MQIRIAMITVCDIFRTVPVPIELGWLGRHRLRRPDEFGGRSFDGLRSAVRIARKVIVTLKVGAHGRRHVVPLKIAEARIALAAQKT